MARTRRSNVSETVEMVAKVLQGGVDCQAKVRMSVRRTKATSRSHWVFQVTASPVSHPFLQQQKH